MNSPNPPGTAGAVRVARSRAGAAAVIAAALLTLVALRQFTNVSRTALFWFAFVLTRPLGATVGDFFSKPVEKGGLGYGTIGATAVLTTALIGLIVYSEWRDRQARAAKPAATHTLGWQDAHQPSPADVDLHLPQPQAAIVTGVPAWPAGAAVSDNTLDSYVGRVRRKLGQVTEQVTITTVHRVGYQCRG